MLISNYFDVAFVVAADATTIAVPIANTIALAGTDSGFAAVTVAAAVVAAAAAIAATADVGAIVWFRFSMLLSSPVIFIRGNAQFNLQRSFVIRFFACFPHSFRSNGCVMPANGWGLWNN